ncbi:zinc-binding alcohol dehydrogenase family protein [Terrilactibacillus laevilacticus]|uniref:zinc-binding alcohol dehydrogenase family protein n=1 Tax=Terrilactibacillus laevilacticus TaxID=1380157 RepID=UPI001146B82B|nr:zinc-binding alcohol dehydrogenase family protein [Terrilactibacillus laevilacticus]
MKAVGLTKYLPISDPESLVDITIAKPHATGHDILVKVKAISINPVDVKVRAPKDKEEQDPKILGWDVAGVVEEVGEEVTLFQPGDEVYYAGSIDKPGCYSEYHLVEENIAARKPTTLSFAEAAALPLTTITAWEALFDRLGVSKSKDINKGKSILIINAAGGVGSIATQLASYFGLTVIGTASRPETVEWSKKHGAHLVINHHEDFIPQLEKEGISSVNYILCLHSTDMHWDQMAKVIAPQGHIASIVETEEPLDLDLLKSKSASFAWEFMFTRALFQTEDRIEQHRLLDEVAKLVDQGIIKTTINEQLRGINASTLRTAHKIVESNQMIGKLVVVE